MAGVAWAVTSAPPMGPLAIWTIQNVHELPPDPPPPHMNDCSMTCRLNSHRIVVIMEMSDVLLEDKCHSIQFDSFAESLWWAAAGTPPVSRGDGKAPPPPSKVDNCTNMSHHRRTRWIRTCCSTCQWAFNHFTLETGVWCIVRTNVNVFCWRDEAVGGGGEWGWGLSLGVFLIRAMETWEVLLRLQAWMHVVSQSSEEPTALDAYRMHTNNTITLMASEY